MKTIGFTLLAAAVAANLQAEKPVAVGNANTVTAIPNLVAFWTFGEAESQPRLSQNTPHTHPLQEAIKTIPRVAGGSYSGYAVKLDGSDYLKLPHKDLKDLDIHGKDAQVSMFVVVEVEEMKKGVTIAGIWSEGKGAHDDSGTRQYSLLANMPAYGGPKQLVPHISSEGGVTRRADGSAFPWCADYAASVSEIPLKKWVTLGMTYDSKYLRAYFNGVMEPRALDAVKDRRNDPYFLKEGPNQGDRGMNPYYHGKGIFKYDPEKHAVSKPDGGADFTVGACFAVGHRVGNPLIGKICGLAVFNRALSDEEMQKLHESANLPALNRSTSQP